MERKSANPCGDIKGQHFMMEHVTQGGVSFMNGNPSPITGVIEEEYVILDFGPYEGRSISEIFDLDRTFYERLCDLRDTGNFAIRRGPDKTFRLYLNPMFQFDV